MRREPIAVAVLCLMAAGACRGPAPPPKLRIAHESDVLSIDPGAHAESVTHSVLSNVYEGLVTFDSEMALAPALAVHWSAPDDETWVFELRKGVTFHDGTPFTAEQVKPWLDRIRGDATSDLRGHLANVSQVEALSPTRLAVRTHRRDLLLLNRLAYVLIARPTHGAPGMAGTGPYRIVRWEKGRVLETEAYAGHWGGRPGIGRVDFVPVEDGPAAVTAVREGRVDVLRWVPEERAGEIRSLPGVTLASRLGLSSYYLWLSGDAGAGRTPFADARVRRAVSMAVDRKALVRALGGGVVANQLVQKGVFGHVADLPELPHDVAGARALLAEAGYPAGFDTELVHRSGATASLVASALRAMLAAAGIRATLRTPDWSQVVDGWTAGTLPFFFAGWRFENGDAYSFFLDCVHSREPDGSRGSSNPGFRSARLDALIEEHGRLGTESARRAHYGVLARASLEEMPMVPLYTRENLYAVSHSVSWTPRLDGRLLAAEMSLAGR